VSESIKKTNKKVVITFGFIVIARNKQIKSI
jgi:hypothetical protein